MADQVIEGTWDEIVQRHDLRGRKLRVIVVDEPATTGNGIQDTWVNQLHAWAASHAPVSHQVDDNRESIYGGSVDDPR